MSHMTRIAIALTITFCFFRCAVQTTPTGGPKDIAPPLLLKSTPKEKETNFKGSVVELTFNEKVKLNVPTEEIIITPSPGKIIDFKASQNRISIEPKDGWKDNTTYSISFREGVQDITESNSADTLHLAFSTGPTIDSLTVYGRIKSSITEQIPKNLTVAIYEADTVDIFKHAAIYFTKTDKDGHFRLENLKGGRYYIYAFEDANKNLKVESTTEKFGFKSNPVTLNEKKPDSIFFSVVKADSRPLKINSIRNT
ncbi:MAG TPA: Ig-like domain-containing domain, partial [Cyclobacteriaceae bacterium]|nr:Ig-like domain-containing domain [Cyclobacteriaceae bacterium]